MTKKTAHTDLPFNAQELAEIREKIVALTTTKKESDVRAYIDKVFPRLPKGMQDEIVVNFFITSLDEEARELEFIAKIQEEGLAASAVLEEIKEEAEKEAGA